MENTPSFAVTEGPLVTLVVPMYNVAPIWSVVCVHWKSRLTGT